MKYKEHQLVRFMPYLSNTVVDGEIVRAKKKWFGGYKYLIQYGIEVFGNRTSLSCVEVDEDKILCLLEETKIK